jgi:metal-sulfur cluster biosynthetic enzyme
MSATTTITAGRVAAALERVIDPELGIDIVDLGLVYGVAIDDGFVHVDLGVTTPACPFARQLAEDAEAAVLAIPDVEAADVTLCREPPWSPGMLSDRARRRLGWQQTAWSASLCSAAPGSPGSGEPTSASASLAPPQVPPHPRTKVS